MNTFVYDSSPSTVNFYAVVDLGSIGDAPISTADNGLAADDFTVELGTDYIVEGDLIIYVESSSSYGEINFTETTYPFGKINISNNLSVSATVVFVAKPQPIILYQKAIVVRKQAWTGSGTLFEIAGGQERIAAPWVGSSGPLRLSGSAVISAADAYNESSIQTYSADTTYGDLGTVGSSVDYGQVDQSSTNEFSYGSITVGDELRPFGSFRWSGEVQSRYFNVYTKVGSGSLFSISGTTVVAAQTDDTFGLFKVFNSTIPDAFSRPYAGSGSLFSIFSNEESRVYRYSSQSIVDPSVTTTDYGSGFGTVTNIIDYGQVAEPGTGDTDYGSMMRTDGIPYGLFRFSGGIDEIFAPVKRAYGHQATGGFNITGNVDVQFNEPTPQIYIVRGNRVDFTTKESLSVNGSVEEKFARSSYQGSGSLFNIGNKIERATFKYSSELIGTTVPDLVVLANDTTTINTATFDDVTVSSGGTGSGSTGGFNIGTHLSFGFITQQNTGLRRFDTFPINSINYDSIIFNAIRGNGSNGGETPDSNDNESLRLWYSVDNGVSFTLVGIIVRYNDATFSALKEVTVTIPEAAKTGSTIFRVEQTLASGNTFDHYGITDFTFSGISSAYTPLPEPVGTNDYGTVDQSAGTIENYGQVAESSSGDTDYAGLDFNDGVKFGLYNLTGAAVVRQTDNYTANLDVNVIPGNVTILPDDFVSNYSGTLTNVTLRDSGTGTGSTGGFNIGRHIAFDGAVTRSVEFVFNTTSYNEIAIDVIRGNSLNGGEEPDTNEDLQLSYSLDGGSTYTFIAIVLAENSLDGVNGVVTKTFTIPTEAKTSSTRFRLAQFSPAGTGIDDYGVSRVELISSSALDTIIYSVPSIYSFTGSATAIFQEPTPQIYDINGNFDRDTISVSSYSEYRYFHVYTPVCSGSLFTLTGGLESATFDYNNSSIVSQGTEQSYGDLGTVTNSVDYGQVSEASIGDTDFGQTVPNTELIPYGLFDISGDSSDSRSRRFVGQGNLFTAGGLVESITNNPPEETVLFNFSGRTAIKQTDDYVGSGSLFSIGDRVERATYSYNESAVLEIGNPNNYGDITTTGTTVDYGFVNEIAVGETDNGSIIDSEIKEPYGLFKISGAAATVAYQRFPWTGYAEIKFTHQPLPTDTRYVPSYDGYYDMSLVWNNSESYSKATYIGEGSLFNIGDRVERATYSYNISSIGELGDPNEYGQISDPVTSTIDYGSVITSTNDQIDQGGIVLVPGDEIPLGKLFTITGTAVENFFPKFIWNRESPPIKIYKGQSKPTDQRFFPWYRSYGEIIITNHVIPYARTRPFIGSGSLFSIGDKLERVTYDYNESSIVEFVPGGSYGDITDPVTTSVDYGSISSIASGDTDLGSIIVEDIIYPYTGLFEFQGTAESQFVRGPYVVKESLLNITGSLVEKVSQTDDTFGSYFITGDGATPRARDFVASGSLFNIGDKVERRAYSYNESSVSTFVPGGSYGSISDPTTTTVDYGSVTGSASGDTDFGNIVETDTTEPFGLFAFSGASSDRWIQVYGYYGDDKDPGTSGSLFTFTGLTESVTSNPPENTVLFEFGQGYSALSFGKGNYDGSGSLFSIGDRVERATYSYNESSTAFTATNINYGTASDYGDITSTSTSTIDYGSVSVVTSDQVDSGGIITTTGNEYPYGLFKIAGSVIQPAKLANWVGSGSLFSVGNAAEVFSAQTPEDTFLYKFTGRAIEKHVERYIGIGNIKIKEETPLAPNAAVRFRPWWRSYGEIFITGAAKEEFRGSYVGGKGVQFTLYTDKVGFEWKNYRPSPRYVNSVYGNIGGSAFTSGVSATQKINVYGYYGDDKDPGTSGSLFGIGGGAESISISEDVNAENITFFTFSGTSPSKWNPAWTSRPDGSPRLSGTPDLQLRFNLFGNVDPTDNFKVYGTPDLKIRRIFTGSGSLFSVGGASEIVGYNPDLETGLFDFKGAGKTNFSLLHVGSGSVFAVGGEANSTTVNPPENTFLYTFNGAGIQKVSVTEIGTGRTSIDVTHEVLITRGYAGEGSLFAAGGEANSVTQSESESTILFTASGSANHSFTRISAATKAEITVDVAGDEAFGRPYIGEGSLFGFGGAAESATVDEESTGLFNFVGNATINRTRDFAGSGSLFGYAGAAEAVAVVPEIQTNLYRFVGTATEKQTDRYVSEGVIEFISGIADESKTQVFTGSGSLFAIGGATESTTSNPPENTILYTVQGRGVIKSAQSHVGSGTEFISGAGNITRTRDFVGSGSLFSVGNAAESKTVAVESIQLFKASGTAQERFVKGTYNTSGTATVSGEVSDIKITYGNQVFAYVSTSGRAIEKQTDDYVGSGSLFGFKNAAVARSIDINTTLPGAQPGDIVSVNLFKVSGSSPSSVTRITQPGTPQLKLSGESVNVLKLFSPIRIFGTII